MIAAPRVVPRPWHGRRRLPPQAPGQVWTRPWRVGSETIRACGPAIRLPLSEPGWPTPIPTGYGRAYRVFVSCDEAIVGRLGGLAMPALFLAAEHDPNSTPAMARRMAAETPRGEAAVSSNARHLVPFVSPEPVNARLRAFLEEHKA